MWQAEEMAYMVEQTQDHLALLGVDSLELGWDARYLADVNYPFLDYIDVSGDKREWSDLCLG
jgi:hypothetical protein